MQGHQVPQWFHGRVIALFVGCWIVCSRSDAAWAATQERATNLSLLQRAAISRSLGREERQYWARRDSSSELLRAENRQHRFDAEFRKDGVRVRWGKEHLALHYFGIAGVKPGAPIRPVVPRSQANQVEYRRDVLTEWYVNGPLGLQQGFTVATRPPGPKAKNLVRIEIGYAGTLRPELDREGRAISWRDGRGVTVLSYRGLLAWDARGRELPARLTLDASTIGIEVVETPGTLYPVTIDPWVEVAKLTASPGGEVTFSVSRWPFLATPSLWGHLHRLGLLRVPPMFS
ncbi:MAG: hypothetical protein KatS3mg077_0749 [Candidatus Binatia bacterium]|nr:MAG: hypothetical protein KatS3mg077_0749 [Candidatus Binatia bacterium]